MSRYDEEALALHAKLRGKLDVQSKVAIRNQDDLSLVYTPGVAAVCSAIEADPERAAELTIRGNTIAIVSDGSAVLGLGNIGPRAAMPVMEGKAMLFREYAGINGFPICLNTQNAQEIIMACRWLTPTFGGINLEDISAPRCFEIESALQDLGIPVMHDDQHGTAIVTLAALLNAVQLTGRRIEDCRVVINGAGAAGTAIAKLLRCIGHQPDVCIPVQDVLVCDSKGILSRKRTDLNSEKLRLLAYTNRSDLSGSLKDAIKGADVFIGVSKGDILGEQDVRTMAKDPILFALANPNPEIMPDVALRAGAAVMGTGRSDFPNQINHVLAFPGIFRGALDAKSPVIDDTMKIAAAHALARCVPDPTPTKVLPSPLEKDVAPQVAKAVAEAAPKPCS